jgi:hypothetical protein
MSDTTYECFQHYGTAADRLTFVPDPAVGIQPIYLWYETDTGNTYLYHTAWIQLNGSGSTAPNLLSYLVQGGGIAWVVDYDFDVAAAAYFIQGFPYSSPQATLTLDDADASDPRIDVIAVNTAGAAEIIKGTAAATPSEPSVDPATQLKLGIILVPANASPAVTNTAIYLENAGDPTEWNPTTSGSGIVTNGTTTPRTGTYDVEATNLPANSYAQFEKGTGSFDPADADILVIYIRSKVTWATAKTLVITLRLNNVVVGSAITISRTGTYGFNSATTGVYQLIAIPISNFAVPGGSLINQLRITGAGTGTTQGFYLDDIIFQVAGASLPPTTGITQAEADARYLQRNNNLSDVASATLATAVLDVVVGDTGSGGIKGLVTAPGSGDAAAGKYLKADGTWKVPAGAGDVSGPASAADHDFAVFNNTTGKLIENKSAADAAALLPAMVGDTGSGGTKGLVPASAAGDAAAGKYLKASGAWSVPTGAGDVVGPASNEDNNIAQFNGANSKTLEDSAYTIAEVIAAGAAAAPQGDVVGPASAAADANIVVFNSTTGKLVKDSGKTIAQVISDVGAGDVVGPAGAEGDNIAVFNSTTGKLIKDGASTIAEVIAAGGAAAPQGDVTAAANIDDHHIVRGAGGAKGVQKSGITIDDSDNITDVVSLAIGAALVAQTKLTIAGQLNIIPSDHAAAGATEEVDFAVSNEHTIILDENLTLTFAHAVNGGRYTIVLIQDGTGTNTVTWPAEVKWPGGTAPVITATADKADLVTLYYNGTVYFGSFNQNYATS